MNKQLLEAVEHIIRSEFSTVRQKAVAVVELVERERPFSGGNGDEARMLERMAQVLKDYRHSDTPHLKKCNPARFYPGLGPQDDRCGICKRAYDLWSEYEAQKSVDRG